jgi:tryptophan-rich sensory protein
MAVFSLYLVWENWGDNRNRAYLFAFFAVVAIFMFFFKRNFRRKMEERNKNQ